jgi:diguanylate cyclase (GGDEF)-like protein
LKWLEAGTAPDGRRAPRGRHPANKMSTDKRATRTRLPRTIAELRRWIHDRLQLPADRETDLLEAIEGALGWQRQLLEQSKQEAIKALSEGFTSRIAQLHHELTQKELTVSNIARYFEELVADLTEKSHRDPKTKLLNFDWFMERLESFLAVEQRVRWCGVGVVDINSFKWYNDTLGHTLGDRIIERVARILAEQIRSEDLLALERPGRAGDLHARFGGDEFCFLVPDLPGFREACDIAERFKRSVEGWDWSGEDPRLATRPVRVDVGVVCLRLGPVMDRRGVSRKLAVELIQWADKLMYSAKGEGASRIHPVCVHVERGTLKEIPDCGESIAGARGGC